LGGGEEIKTVGKGRARNTTEKKKRYGGEETNKFHLTLSTEGKKDQKNQKRISAREYTMPHARAKRFR